MLWISLLAQTAASDPLNDYGLKSLGIAGFLLVLLIYICRTVYKDMRADNDALRAAAQLANQTLAANQVTQKQQVDQGEITNRLLTELKARSDKAL
jgi:hypothetical protein